MNGRFSDLGISLDNIVKFGGIDIGDGHPCRVVAELGTNHQGDLKLAKRLAREAKDAGCDFVKLQVRTPELAVPRAEWDDLRETPWGPMTKLEYRSRVELSDEALQGFQDYCAAINLPWFASVWDIPALDRLHSLPVDFIGVKIPSARLQDDNLLKAAAMSGKPVILSTGMSNLAEVLRAYRLMEKVKGSIGCITEMPVRPTDIILLQCTSMYPARADESNLRVIRTYKQMLACPVGFSSHKIGIQTCLLAVAVGANLIERHITLDRGTRGSDHRMSSEPGDLVRLIKEIRYTEACLGDGNKIVYLNEEAERKRLRGS